LLTTKIHVPTGGLYEIVAHAGTNAVEYDGKKEALRAAAIPHHAHLH